MFRLFLFSGGEGETFYDSYSDLFFFDLVDLDPEDNLNEEEFEEEFHVAPADDPEEELKREEALVVNENMIKETNEKFLNGEITWYDAVNEFDNLPEVPRFGLRVFKLKECK